MKLVRPTLSNIGDRLSSPSYRFYAFVTFLVIVFFTGGGARDDVQSLLLLRPLAIIFAAYAVTVKFPKQWQSRKFPLYITAAFAVLMLAQLIPLPPSIWTALPQRQIFVDIANMAGIEQPWRALSMSPSKTLNSLFSLCVPIAATMLYLNLSGEDRRKAIPVIIGLCAISALWGIFQIIGPSRGPLYLYRITNFSTGVGLFANRNHQAIMLASTITMLGWYAASQRRNAPLSGPKFYASIVTILVLIPLIFVIGSRAGLLIMIPATIMAMIFLYLGNYHSRYEGSKGRIKKQKLNLFSTRNLVLMASAVAIIGIALTTVLLSRSLALGRLLGAGELIELRFQLLPTLLAMIENHMPWGSGFGSFEHLYKIYEPQELLSAKYLNQAHNDWFQYLIEGGLPAIAIAACAAIWFTTRLVALMKNWRASTTQARQGLLSVAIIAFLLLASIADYPLRVPSIIAIFAVLGCILNDSVRSLQRKDRK